MITLEEGDLRLDLPDPVTGRKFDDAAHGLSHCMSAVDWIVELATKTCFVEVKDPDNPAAKRHGQSREFVDGFLSGELDKNLRTKFRDTFLYEWACDRVGKPILYVVIVASSAMDDAQRITRMDSLRRELPVGTPDPWKRPVAKDCMVVGVETWNKSFPELRLSRLSEGA